MSPFNRPHRGFIRRARRGDFDRLVVAMHPELDGYKVPKLKPRSGLEALAMMLDSIDWAWRIQAAGPVCWEIIRHEVSKRIAAGPGKKWPKRARAVQGRSARTWTSLRDPVARVIAPDIVAAYCGECGQLFIRGRAGNGGRPPGFCSSQCESAATSARRRGRMPKHVLTLRQLRAHLLTCAHGCAKCADWGIGASLYADDDDAMKGAGPYTPELDDPRIAFDRAAEESDGNPDYDESEVSDYG